MARIPKFEQTTDFRPAMQPFSSGDGYEAPGRGLQRIGQGIAALGQGIGSLQGQIDQYDEHNAKLAALKFNDDMDRDDAEAQAAFNPDKDDLNAWIAGRQQRLQERAASTYEGITSQRGRQLLDLHLARRGNASRAGYQQFAIGVRQQKLFNGTERAITGEFDKLSSFQAVEPSADAENQAGYAGANAPPATADPGTQYIQRFEGTLRAAEAIISDMPATPQQKQALSKHAASLAMAALGRKQDAWPAVEQWLAQQREGIPAAGAAVGPQATTSRGGSPMAVAQQFLGASETRDTKVLSEFFQKSGGQKLSPADTAWCAAFVNAALGASGQKGTGTLLARDFLKIGSATDKPAEGDIVVLSRGNPNGWQGHVGFYAGRDANGNVMVLGGNQGNKVSVQSYPASRVLGYRKPPEAGTKIDGLNLPQRVAQAAGPTATDASQTAVSPIAATLTAYAPQAGASNTSSQQGNYLSARPGPDGKNEVRTLDDFASGRSPYITIAGNPSLNGKSYTIPRIEYQGKDGKVQVLENVRAVVHDTGGAFKNAPEGRFDVPVARDVGEDVRNANHALWKKAGVEFVPAGQSQSGQGRAPASPAFSAVRSELTESLLKAAPAMREGYRKQVEGQIAAVEGMGMYTVDQQTIGRLGAAAEKSGDPVLIQRAQLLPLRSQIAKATAQAPPEALTAEIQRMEAQAAAGPTTPQQVAAIEQLKAQRKETEKGLTDTPYEHATKVQILPGPVAPLSPAMNPEEFRGALEQRAVARTVIESQMGREIPLLQGREQQDVIDFLKNPQVTVDQRAAMLRTMYDTLGKNRMIRDAQTIFGQDAPEMVAISWVAAQNGDPMFLKDALRGYDLRQTKGFVSRLPSNDDIRFRMDASLTKAFVEMPESAYNAMAAARLAYEVRAERAQVDPKQKGFSSESGRIWDAALQAAMGRNEDRVGGRVEIYGGVVDGMVIPPWLKANGGMDEIRQALRFGDLPPNLPQVVPSTDEQPLLTMPNVPQQNEAMTAAGQSRATAVPQGGSPMAVPGWGPISSVPDVNAGPATAPDPKGQFAGMPGTPDGKPVPMSVIRAATPVWIGGSNYKLRTGYDSMGNAVYVGVLGHPDLKYILNMDGVRKRLENIQPGGRPRIREGTFRVRE